MKKLVRAMIVQVQAACLGYCTIQYFVVMVVQSGQGKQEQLKELRTPPSRATSRRGGTRAPIHTSTVPRSKAIFKLF